MSARRFSLLLAFAITAPGLLHAASPKTAIAVSATAVKDYARTLDESGALHPETYVFAEGRFFGGITANRGLSRTTFADITLILANNLAAQQYFPTTDPKAADLLIMVHWGATTIYEDPQQEFNLRALHEATASYNAAVDAGIVPDTSEMNHQLSLQDDARNETQRSIWFNANLLGYRRTLDKARRSIPLTAEEVAMVHDLNKERYFVILMAYDNQTFTTEGKSKLLWTTRISIRSAGCSFPTALKALAQAGSEVFGQHIDHLAMIRTTSRRGEVILGELQVLGEDETQEVQTAPTEK